MKALIFRLNNIGILVTAFLYVFARGRAVRIKESLKTIIVFHAGKLGDMVCATPVFRAIKLSYPDAKIILLGTEKSHNVNKALLEGNNDIDVCDFLGSKSFFAAVRKIKTYKADYAISITPDYRALAAMYVAGVPMIAVPKVEGGWSPYETKPYKILRNLVVSVPYTMGNYAPREYLRLLEPIGIYKDDTRKHVYFGDQAKLFTEKFISEKISQIKNNISEKPIKVAMALGAGNEIKKWPVKNFAALAAAVLSRKNAIIFLVGNKKDADEAGEVLKEDANNKIINTCGQFSLDEFKAFISQMDVFIGVDTGPVYIAEALNVATIDIVGPMDEKEQPPCGPRHKLVVPVRKKPELHIMNARVYDREEAIRQVEGTTPQMVMTAFDELFP